ncbi:transporter substrate-binding domain-containing protein [Psychromonas sp. 14N.309.X.WAT.B.A12]|jgi:polar amino acid transport system substrate-binding protein|uniref:transporter substrate-binding domain-containing protein n=1 Tax=unclassified Psychromonas TaxID=2614957 RepID=UPI0025AFB564|nr:transporter substrate-binding domain-containing protein [Psychromonas sp. 14N.309.X.WAT.B.A12]MDN2664843.1 transporter substrate-binding domain-containing protein [Psychromonas sp. 14N.309.X.WAT.B.A12]
MKTLLLPLKKTLLTASLLCATFTQIAQADLLDDIKQKGEIVIATEARYAPFEMLEDGKIVGYGKDILDEILKDLPGVKLTQLDLPFQGILAGLSAKRYDFVATSLTITQKRMDKYAFSYPISTAAIAILKRKGDDRITKPEDMGGMRIGTQAGSSQLTVIENFEKEVLLPQGEGYKSIKHFTDYNEAYAALASRRIDIVPQALPNLAPIVKQRPDIFEIVQPAFGPETYYGWVGRKDADSTSLVQFFSDGIEKLQKSGKLAELQQKWFGFTMDLPVGELPTPQH